MTQVTNEHLRRAAVVYVRQSTIAQIQHNSESRKRQYGLEKRAREIGFSTVEVIDDDLGLSGSSFVVRPGFQKLVTLVCSGEVGGIVCIEASRLARNGRDWHHLMDLCAVVGTLLIDHDGVYDPRLVNDRLLLGLKGTMSEYELSLLRQRAIGARDSKANRGELRFGLPPGYCWDELGRIEKDPDQRVVEAIDLVFNKFVELGSARQVFLWLHDMELQLPVVRQSCRTRIHWQLPSYHNVLAILKHPIYAGAYAFGRTETRVQVVDGRAIKTAGHRRPRQEWTVLLQDQHPAFITWDEFERNQVMLEDNAHMKKRAAPKSGRGGRALLAGLLRCGRCGHMLRVSYGSRSRRSHRYLCKGDELRGARSLCLGIGGIRVDRAVSREIVRAVSPVAVEAAKAAAAKVQRGSAEIQQAVQRELQQAKDEARLAERRYEAVDPEKRLVASELESRWESSLNHVAEVESRLQALSKQEEHELSVSEETLAALAQDLYNTWNSPSASMRTKQRIVQILVEEIVADVDEAAQQVVLVVHWAGGRHTELRVARNRNHAGSYLAGNRSNAVEAVRKMASGWSDQEIALTLNRMRCEYESSSSWTQRRVGQLRERLGLPPFDPETPRDETVTREQAAEVLGICVGSVKKLIDHEVLPANQAIPGAPWEIPTKALQSEAVQQGVERIQARRPANLKKTRDNQTLILPGFAVEDA